MTSSAFQLPRRWSVVVPSNRPDRLQVFLESWRPLFDQHHVKVFVVHDQETVTDMVDGVEQFAWDNIPLKHAPRFSDMIRSYGMYQAWLYGSEYTLTLDDDVLPYSDPFQQYQQVFDTGAPLSDYLNVGALTTYGKPLRGFPFKDRTPAQVTVQYGGWHGVLDYDAPTQLAGVNDTERFSNMVVPVPRGTPVTGCIMNCAWRTSLTPIMWQLPLVNGKYNRFGDIWSGLFQKRTLDMLGHVMVVNGAASVQHKRASDPIANLERETPGVRLNETLWDTLLQADPKDSPVGCYRSVTDTAASHFPDDYRTVFLDARDEWLSLFT